jgi:Autoinducer binding domain
MYKLAIVINALLREDTREALIDKMTHVLGEMGVTHFALVRLSASGTPIDELFLGGRPGSWLDRYAYKDNPFADPVVRHAKETIEPFFFTDVADHERVERAREFGIVNDVMIVSVPGPHGIVGTAWLVATRHQLETYPAGHHFCLLLSIRAVCGARLRRHPF